MLASPTRAFAAVLALLGPLLFLGVACREAEGDDPGECEDDADNDEDGLFDCDDDDCEGADVCSVPPVPPVETEEYITGGQVTRAFAATGALVAYNGKAFCTGTLVAPDRVLTAAHCVQNQSQGSMMFTLGADLGEPAAAAAVNGIAIAPGWTGNVQAGADLAVLSLATEITQILPINVYLGGPEQAVGSSITLVGYGRQASDQITGIRRLARVTLEQLSPQTLVYNFNGQGACHGDSGGPAFAQIGGEWHQIGVTSWGDPSCLSVGHYQRLDVLASWLEQQGVPAPRAVDCQSDGTCDGQCEEDEDCWGMMCPSGDCTAPAGRCVSDGACDADCGYADPDCGGGGGQQDQCAIYGLYGNGVCNQGCWQPDPDCTQQQCYPGFDPYAGICYAATPSGQVCATWYPYCDYYNCWC